MTVTLFPRKDFEGSTFVVDRSHSVMSNTPIGHGATSIRLSTASDAVLLVGARAGRDSRCSSVVHPTFHTSVGQRRGENRVRKRRALGAHHAVRATRPFPCRHYDRGRLPRQLVQRGGRHWYVQDMVAVAAAIWAPFLIRLDFNGVSFTADDKLFDVRGEFIKLARADKVFNFRQGMANPVLVERVGVFKGVAASPSLPVSLPKWPSSTSSAVYSPTVRSSTAPISRATSWPTS